MSSILKAVAVALAIYCLVMGFRAGVGEASLYSGIAAGWITAAGVWVLVFIKIEGVGRSEK